MLVDARLTMGTVSKIRQRNTWYVCSIGSRVREVLAQGLETKGGRSVGAACTHAGWFSETTNDADIGMIA